jgi:hypothetical protein
MSSPQAQGSESLVPSPLVPAFPHSLPASYYFHTPPPPPFSLPYPPPGTSEKQELAASGATPHSLPATPNSLPKK